MVTGLGSLTARQILDQLCNAGTWADPVGFFVQLHTADPGAAGTTSVANNAVRHTATFSSAICGGSDHHFRRGHLDVSVADGNLLVR